MDTEELLKSKNVYFKYSGGDLLVNCFNPEHEDNNPSMRIDKITGIFNCLSCGFTGNIFKYYETEINLLHIKAQKLKQKIAKINVQRLSIPLSAVPFEDEYRGISANTFKRFEAFTCDDKEYEGRIVFPIYDITGDILLFNARYLYSDLEPKYINLPRHIEKPYYPTVPDEIINGSIILVEGLFDLLNLWDKGLRNVVCVFGSTIVSKKDRGNVNLVHKFSKYKLQGVNKLILLFDGDKAGRDGAKKLMTALKNNYIIEIYDLEEGKDPGQLTTKEVIKLKEDLYG